MMTRMLGFLLLFFNAPAVALVFPVGGEKNHEGFVISLDLGGSWFSKSKGKWLQGHLGEDYAALDGQSLGKLVRAMTDGEIVFAQDGGTAWGEVVIVRHREPNGQLIYSQYAHLQSLRVKKGELASEGQVIGEIGRVVPWSPHLHFEIKTQEALDKEGLVGHGYSGTDGLAPDRIKPSDYIGASAFTVPSAGLRLTSIYPVGEVGVLGQEIPIILEFTEPIAEETILSNLIIGPDPVLSLDPQFALSKDKKKIVIFGQRFSYDLPYTILINPGLKSQSGDSFSAKFFFKLREDSAGTFNCFKELAGKIIYSKNNELWFVDPDTLTRGRIFWGQELSQGTPWDISPLGECIWCDSSGYLYFLSSGILRMISYNCLIPSLSEASDLVFTREKSIYRQDRGTMNTEELFHFDAPFSHTDPRLRMPNSSHTDYGRTHPGVFLLRGNRLFAVEVFSCYGVKLWMINLQTKDKTLLLENETLIPSEFKTRTQPPFLRRKEQDANWNITGLTLSRDGKRLVFIKETYYYNPEPDSGAPIGDLFMLNLETGELKLLTDFCRLKEGYYCLERPYFLLDGERIAFLGYTPYKGDAVVYVLNPKTEECLSVAESGYCLVVPAQIGSNSW